MPASCSFRCSTAGYAWSRGMPSPAVRLSPSATMRGGPGCDRCDGCVGCDGCRWAVDAGARFAELRARWSGARIHRTKSPQAQRGKGERDSILSILPLTSYTPVRGHHRLSAGVGARASGSRAWPSCRRDRHPHAGAEVVRLQTRRRARPAMHARRSLADGRRRRAGGGHARPATRLSSRRSSARAALDAVAASRPHRVCQRRSVARDRAPRPGVASRRAGPRFRSDRPRALRARALLQAGRRHGHRPRAHREGRSGAARRGQPALSRAAAFAVGHRARARRAHRRGDRGASAGRAARRVGAGAGRARHHLATIRRTSR